MGLGWLPLWDLGLAPRTIHRVRWAALPLKKKTYSTVAKKNKELSGAREGKSCLDPVLSVLVGCVCSTVLRSSRTLYPPNVVAHNHPALAQSTPPRLTHPHPHSPWYPLY